MTTITPVDEAAEHVVAVLRNSPSGLFTDIDGTISHIARVPSAAVVGESPRAALRAIGTSIAAVGAITGRGAADASSMLQLDGVMLIGNHGYERIQNGERFIHPSAIGSRANVAACARLVQEIVDSTSSLAGVVVEDKELSASIHYRLVVDQGRAVQLLRELTGAIAELHDLNMTDGKLVFEVRPRALVNKGTAIHDIANELGLSGVVYLGDDVTDVDAFRALAALRSPECSTLSIGIVSPETHQVVRDTADLLIEGVDRCIALLEKVAALLPPSVE